MGSFSTDAFIASLALIGVVILISALLSGLIERTGFPQVAVFLALGAALGPAGLGVLRISLDSPMLRVVATLSLALVLFTDAVTLDLREVRTYRALALLMIGPGTLLSAALLGLLAWALLGLSPAAAAVIGAALASTDPVLLRGLLRERSIPGSVRQALKLESGFNDAVLLPIVLVAMAFLGHDTGRDATGWSRLGLDLFLLGPGAGVLVALVSIGVLDVVRRRVGIRRDYESLYSLGVALAAYSLAESVHGSGFLAAFAAGLTISWLDVELCDCFLEYGETTSEMALLLTFVLFGSSLIWDGFLALSGAVLLFAVLALTLRIPVVLLALSPARLARDDRALIAWFGPRGLSTLLEVLLPVFAGHAGGRHLFEICCLVVLLSVLLHGGTPIVLSRRRRRSAAPTTEPAVAVTLGAVAALPARAIASTSDRPALGGNAAGDHSPVTMAAAATPHHVDADRGTMPDVPAEFPAEQPDQPAASRAPAEMPVDTTGSVGGQRSRGSAADSQVVTGAAPIAIDGHLPTGAALPMLVAHNRTAGHPLVADRERITIPEMRHLQELHDSVVIVDARTDRTRNRSELQARGAFRMPPDHVRERAVELQIPRDAWVVVYCA